MLNDVSDIWETHRLMVLYFLIYALRSKATSILHFVSHFAQIWFDFFVKVFKKVLQFEQKYCRI